LAPSARVVARGPGRQILDLDMTDDDDEGEEEGADADGVSADGEDGRPRSAEERPGATGGSLGGRAECTRGTQGRIPPIRGYPPSGFSTFST